MAKKQPKKSNKIEAQKTTSFNQIQSASLPIKIGLVLVLLLLIIGIVKIVNIQSEKRLLNQSSQRLDYISANVDRELGSDVTTNKDRDCWRVETTPLTDGRLVCGVELKGVVVAASKEEVNNYRSELYSLLQHDKALGNPIGDSAAVADGNNKFKPLGEKVTCEFKYPWSDIDYKGQPLAVSFSVTCSVYATQRYFAEG
jgi:hypothetical protein